jgi:hypothetical protein
LHEILGVCFFTVRTLSRLFLFPHAADIRFRVFGASDLGCYAWWNRALSTLSKSIVDLLHIRWKQSSNGGVRGDMIDWRAGSFLGDGLGFISVGTA